MNRWLTLARHPRALKDMLLTYPRYLGTIKPGLLGASEREREALLKSMRSSWWPGHLEPPVGKRVLVIAPHPDDETIGAGGFLLRHRGLASLHAIVVCDGAGGGKLPDLEPDDPAYASRLVETRRAELASVASRLGFESCVFLDLPDGRWQPTAEVVQRFAGLVSAVDPDVVLLPWMLDGLRDHRLVNVLYASACAARRCTVLGYEIWSMLSPNCALDITDVLDEKLDLVRLYRSQLETMDYLNLCEGLARARAFYTPVRERRSGAAEAFFALPNHEYCEIVTAIYGTAEHPSEAARQLAP